MGEEIRAAATKSVAIRSAVAKKIVLKKMPLVIEHLLPESDRPKCDIEFIQVHKDRLYTSGENGIVNVWSTSDLQLVDQVDINHGGILTILVDNDLLYAATSAGAIVVWDLKKNAIHHELQNHDSGVLVLRMFNGLLYSGDSEGKVSVWKDNQIVNQHETCEEVWDMILSDEYLYSVRDRDLVIQKFCHQSKLTMHITLEGRAPLCRVDGKLCLLTRDGLDIQVLEDKGQFPIVAMLKGQDRIVNALGCNADTRHLYSAGWDNCVRSWDLKTFTRLDAIDLGQAINCIRVDPRNGAVYVGANRGVIAKLRDD